MTYSRLNIGLYSSLCQGLTFGTQIVKNGTVFQILGHRESLVVLRYNGSINHDLYQITLDTNGTTQLIEFRPTEKQSGIMSRERLE